MNLPILGNSYKLKHFITGLFHLAFFKVQSFCSMTQNIIPWEDWIIPSCTYIPHFVYPFIYWDIRVIFTFWLVWLMLSYILAYNVSLSFYFQLFYTYTEKNGITGSYGNSIFNFLSNKQFFSGLHYSTFPPPMHNVSNFSIL